MHMVFKLTLSCFFLLVILSCTQKTPQEHIVDAQEAFVSGNYDEAIINYKAAVQQDPKNAEIRLAIAELYLNIGLYQSAEKEFKKAKEHGAQESDLNHNIARLLWHLGKADELIEFYEIEVKKTNEEVSFYAFLASLTSDNLQKANEIANNMNNSAQDSAFSLLANAYLGFVAEKKDEVDVLISKALMIDPRLLPAIKLKALIAINESNYEEVDEAIRQYSGFAPYDFREQVFFAETYIQFKKLEPAKQIIESLAEPLKGAAALDQLQGHVFYIEQDFLLAQQHIERAIQNGARTTKNLIIAGYVNYTLQNYERAHYYLMSVKDLINEDHPALKILAIAQMKLGKTIEAAELLRRSSVGDKREIPAYTTATQRLLANGQFELAQELVTQLKSAPNPTPLDIVQIGLAKFSVSDPSGVEDIKTIIENNPNMIEAQMALVSIYLKSGQPEVLIDIAREWQTKPNANDALKLRGFNLEGIIQERLNDSEAARKAYTGALEVDENNIHSLVFLAKFNMDAGKNAEADINIAKALAVNPVSYDALLLAYNNKVAQTEHAAALDLLANTHKKYPDNLLVSELYAIGLHFQGKLQRLLELANDLEYISDNMYQVIADAHLKLGDTKRATEVYKEWDSKSPRNRVPFLHYIYLLENEAKYTEALAAIVRKRRSFAEDIGLKALHAQFLLYQARVEDAKDLIEEIKKQDPSLTSIENLEVQVPLFERQFKSAIPNLLKNYETKPTDRKGYNIVLAYIGANDFDALLTFSKRHLSAFPKSIQIRNAVANVDMQRGNYEDALDNFLLVLEGIPNSPAILNNIAWLHYKQGNVDAAWTFAKRALDAVPNDYNVLDTAALILAAQGKYEEAVAFSKMAYLQVVEKNPENRTQITLNFIKVLEQAGKNDDAQNIRRRYGL